MKPNEENVFDVIEDKRSYMVELLKELVKIDTQVPPGFDYDKICDVLAIHYNEFGFNVSQHVAPDKYLKLSGAELIGLKGPRTNLIAKLTGVEGGKTLHISAHTDTAAIQKDGWTTDPLGGLVTKDNKYGKSLYDRGGGYIWGRGVGDDKGELAALTLAVKSLYEAGIKLEGNLIITANCDEEIGGVAGLGFLIKEGLVKADYGVQLDGSLTGIGLAAQGRARFLIKTHGKSYHGQVPILGINAIEKMSKINVALNDYWRNVLLKRKVAAPGIDFGDSLRAVGVECPTGMLNIGTIKGGVQGATVPDLCEEEVLRGMVPGETYEGVIDEFKSVLNGVKATDNDLNYELETINLREGYVVSATDPYAVECQSIIHEAIGRILPFTGSLASTDMNYQVNKPDSRNNSNIGYTSGGLGIPCVSFGVGGPHSNGHKQDENASIDEIIECAKAVALIIMRKLGAS